MAYWNNVKYDQNMHYWCRCDTYFSITYRLSVYSVTYKNLSHTHPGNGTAAEKGEYIPTNKYTESERKYLSNISSIHSENQWILMKYFILKNHWENRTWSDRIDTVSCSLTWENGWYHITPWLLDWYNKIRLVEVYEY